MATEYYKMHGLLYTSYTSNVLQKRGNETKPKLNLSIFILILFTISLARKPVK